MVVERSLGHGTGVTMAGPTSQSSAATSSSSTFLETSTNTAATPLPSASSGGNCTGLVETSELSVVVPAGITGCTVASRQEVQLVAAEGSVVVAGQPAADPTETLDHFIQATLDNLRQSDPSARFCGSRTAATLNHGAVPAKRYAICANSPPTAATPTVFTVIAALPTVSGAPYECVILMEAPAAGSDAFVQAAAPVLGSSFKRAPGGGG